MERECFNNTKKSKLSAYRDDIIRFYHFAQIDRLQFSVRSVYAEVILGQLRSLFEYVRPVKVGKKFILEFRHGRSQIQFVRWGYDEWHGAIIIQDPDDEIQNRMLEIMRVCPMNLKEVEVAFDFYPNDPRDLNDLRRVLTDGLVLKYSRPNCYSKDHETEYIGKGGHVRKGSKGIRIYITQRDNRYFLRIEPQFNRDFIKRKPISLPVGAGSFILSDFIDYREQLDEDRLLNLLCKRWAKPIKRAADVEMLRGLARRGILSWISTQLTEYGHRPVCDQISQFKKYLKPDKLSHRSGEFFPKSSKKAMILADIQNGFVRKGSYGGCETIIRV